VGHGGSLVDSSPFV